MFRLSEVFVEAKISNKRTTVRSFSAILKGDLAVKKSNDFIFGRSREEEWALRVEGLKRL